MARRSKKTKKKPTTWELIQRDLKDGLPTAGLELVYLKELVTKVAELEARIAKLEDDD